MLGFTWDEVAEHGATYFNTFVILLSVADHFISNIVPLICI